MPKYVFEILVYRKDEKSYQLESEEEKSKHSNYPDEYTRKIMAEDWDRRFFRCWHFNDVVGWLRLYVDWTCIKAEYYKVDAKRLIRNPVHKKFVFQTWKLLECHFFNLDIETNQSIYEEVLRQLEYVAKARIGKCHLDVSVFREVGPHIDWKGLIGRPGRI